MNSLRTLDRQVYRILSQGDDVLGLEGLSRTLNDESLDVVKKFYKETIILQLKEETKSLNEHMQRLDEESGTYFKNAAFIDARNTLFRLLDTETESSKITENKAVLINHIKIILKAIIQFKRQYRACTNALNKAWRAETRKLNENLADADGVYNKQKIELVEVFRETPDGNDQTTKSPHRRIMETTNPMPRSELRVFKPDTSLKKARDLNTKYKDALEADKKNKIPAKTFMEIIISALGLDDYFPTTEKASKPISTDVSTEENILFPGADNDEPRLSENLSPPLQNAASSKSANNASSVKKVTAHLPPSNHQEQHESPALRKRELVSLENTQPLLKAENNAATHKKSVAQDTQSTTSTSTSKRATPSVKTISTAKPSERTLLATSHRPASANEAKIDTESSWTTLINLASQLMQSIIDVSEHVSAYITKTNEAVAPSEQKAANRVKPTSKSKSNFEWLEKSHNYTAEKASSQPLVTTSSVSETEDSHIKSLKAELDGLKKICVDNNLKLPDTIKKIDQIQKSLNAKDARFQGKDKKYIEEHFIFYKEPLEKEPSLKFISHSKADADLSPMRSLRVTTNSIYLADHLKDIYEKIEKSCKNHQYNLRAEEDLTRHTNKYHRNDFLTQAHRPKPNR